MRGKGLWRSRALGETDDYNTLRCNAIFLSGSWPNSARRHLASFTGPQVPMIDSFLRVRLSEEQAKMKGRAD